VASDLAVFTVDQVELRSQRAHPRAATADRSQFRRAGRDADTGLLPSQHHRVRAVQIDVSHFDAYRTGDAVRFSVRLQPRASKNEITGLQGFSLKVRVTAPPVDGMANQALIDFLSETLAVARRDVRIVSGLTSRTKVVEIREGDLGKIQRLAD